MFFIDIESEAVAQENDRIRISVKRSSGTADHSPVAKVEIKPESTESFIEVSDPLIPLDSSKWLLDWEYNSDGLKTIVAKFTFEDLSTQEKSLIISILSEADDYLFSNDDDLAIHETDIRNYLRLGKTTFKNFHRRAQTLILAELDRKGLRNEDNTKITKAQIIDKSEVKEWSTFLTMRLIFESVSNAKDDIFRIKAIAYDNLHKDAKDRAFLAFDSDKSGTLEESETNFMGSAEIFR